MPQYISDKMSENTKKLNTESSDVYIFSRQFLSIYTFLIFVGSILRVFIYSRVNPKAAQIIRLCYNVIFFASGFSIYFFMWVLIFTISYLILGLIYGGHSDTGHDGDDYENLTNFWGLFMYSYGTTIGNLEAPNAELWKKIEKETWKQELMVYVIWIVWMLE